MQDCSISIALAMEILQSCTRPSILFPYKMQYCWIFRWSIQSKTTTALMWLGRWYIMLKAVNSTHFRSITKLQMEFIVLGKMRKRVSWFIWSLVCRIRISNQPVGRKQKYSRTVSNLIFLMLDPVTYVPMNTQLTFVITCVDLYNTGVLFT